MEIKDGEKKTFLFVAYEYFPKQVNIVFHHLEIYISHPPYTLIFGQNTVLFDNVFDMLENVFISFSARAR